MPRSVTQQKGNAPENPPKCNAKKNAPGDTLKKMQCKKMQKNAKNAKNAKNCKLHMISFIKPPGAPKTT